MPRFCSEPDCGGKHTARGLCKDHYQQHKKLGTLPPLTMKTKPEGSYAGMNLGDLDSRPVPAKATLVEKAMKVAEAILDNPEATQAERNTVLRIVLPWVDDRSDPEMKEKLMGVLSQVRGGRAS